MSSLSIAEQLKQRKLRLQNSSNQTSNFDSDEKKEVNQQTKSQSTTNNPIQSNDNNHDNKDNNQSKQMEINHLKNQIKEKQSQINQLQNEVNELNKKLSALTANETQNQTQNQNQSESQPQPQSQPHRQPPNQSELTQEELDREIALQLQRNLDNEQLQQQQQQQQHQSNIISFHSQSPFGPSSIFQELNEMIPNRPSPFPSPLFSTFSAFQTHNLNPNNDNISNGDFFRSFFSFHGNPVDIDGMSFEQLSNMFPAIPRGANQETINNLPTESFKTKQNIKEDEKKENEEEKKEDNNNNNNNKKKEVETCSICLEEFKDGDTIRRLPCFHIFHKNEIDKWLKTNHICPICRSPIEQNQ